ncbi:MAG TPA: EAL domain-containing protein [Casimicrobiaceae bacterium]|nr:EAL domain-containing protein [Casimicrobiaceae bacterium]
MSSELLEDIYIARQPIVDRGGSLSGFELLFRSTERNVAELNDNVLATSSVIATAFADIGLAQVIGPVDGFLNVDSEFLFSELVEALPADRIVIELLEQVAVDDAVIERCQLLRKRGYRIALDNFVGNLHDIDPLLRAVDIVKVDVAELDALLLPEMIDVLRPYAVKLLALKVETAEQFEQCKSLGFDYFQGFHFACPELISAKRAKPAKIALLKLLSLAMGDAEVREIEDAFRLHPTLAVNLLRLVNSAALRRQQTVTSLRHALVLLGRKQLRVWLQLLLYTADRGNTNFGNPLLQLAAVRGKLMELLAARRPGPESTMVELAFITGILSLMSVVLEMSTSDILDELNLPPLVGNALLERQGALGDMLALVEGIERDDPVGVDAALGRVPGVSRSDLVQAQLSAYHWANELTSPA